MTIREPYGSISAVGAAIRVRSQAGPRSPGQADASTAFDFTVDAVCLLCAEANARDPWPPLGRAQGRAIRATSPFVPDRTYSDEETQAILKLAIEQHQSRDGGLRHDELVAAAAELGVEAAAIDRAIATLDRQQPIQAELVRIEEKRRRSLVQHVTTYLVVNTFLLGIDLLTGGGLWFYWPLLGWGLAVALQATRAVWPDRERDRERAQKIVGERERKALRESRRAERQRVVEDFVDTVEQGALAVVDTVSRRLRPTTDGRRDDRGGRR